MYFELPFRLKRTEKIHTERFFKFPSNIYAILYAPDPLVKVKFNLKSDRVNLVTPVSPIECLLYLPDVRGEVVLSTNWERKSLPGSEN